MRRPVDAADPARHVLLGLLLSGPHHGYDLARSFARGTALGNVVYLSGSHLYALLGRLERDGLVAGEREEQGARPPRRVYHLTDAGKADVWRWIAEPVERPRDVLLDFPLKLYLALRIDQALAASLVAQQRALFASYLAGLEREGDLLDGPAEDRAFLGLLREGRIARTRSTVDWLDHCAVVLSAVEAHA